MEFIRSVYIFTGGVDECFNHCSIDESFVYQTETDLTRHVYFLNNKTHHCAT